MNNSINVEVVKNSFMQRPGDYKLCSQYSIVVTNKGEQPAQIKVPLARYISFDNQVEVQKNWGKKANGNKGITLLGGTFCQMDLVFEREMNEKKGERLLITIELGKQLGRICFTFECTGEKINRQKTPNLLTNFVLIAAASDVPPEPTGNVKSQTSMSNALKRIELLEDGLSEVLRNLDKMKRDFSKLEVKGRFGSIQTLSEVFAWLAIHERVSAAELRTRLLPLNVLTGALINEINEMALEIAGEVVLEEVGNEIIVTRKTLGQILGSLDVTQFEKGISS